MRHPVWTLPKNLNMTKASRKPTLRSQAHLQGTQSQRRKCQPCKRACLHLRCTSSIPLLCFLFLTLGLTSTYGQTPSRTTIFSSPTLSQLIQQPPTPQAATFQRIDINQYTPQQNLANNFNNAPLLNTTYNQLQNNQAIIQEVERFELLKQQQLEEAKQDIRNFGKEDEYNKYRAASQPYINSYYQLSKLNPDSFSITKAIYLVENAFDNNKFSYQQFENAVKQRANFVKQILKREGINSTNNTALNYGIQKLYSQPNNVINPKTKQLATLQPLKYDFKDYMGKQDHRQMFVSKLLMTGKGQCHSMPLLYLAIAEQLGAKAYLSLAPEHSFIQFFDEQGKCISYETTNGNLVSQSFMIQSGYINAASLKNKLFLDTLSQRRLFAQCLADLLIGYQTKFGYDDFTNRLNQQIQNLDPNNLTARIINENIATYIAMQQIKAVGSPPLKDLQNYPQAYSAYQAMLESYKQTDDLGYQQMPKEVYQAWRSSVAKEKKKQETKQIEQQLKAEIEMLKKLKTKIIFPPKG